MGLLSTLTWAAVRFDLLSFERIPFFTIMLSYFGLFAAYDRLVGQLVKSNSWGFFAARDSPLTRKTDRN
jgi:hypothetical protein